MILDLITENKEFLSGLIATVVAFFGGRKSKKQSEKSTELENIEKVRQIEKKLLSDMEDQVDKLIKYNDYLETVVKDVKQKLVKYSDKFGAIE